MDRNLVLAHNSATRKSYLLATSIWSAHIVEGPKPSRRSASACDALPWDALLLSQTLLPSSELAIIAERASSFAAGNSSHFLTDHSTECPLLTFLVKGKSALTLSPILPSHPHQELFRQQSQPLTGAGKDADLTSRPSESLQTGRPALRGDAESSPCPSSSPRARVRAVTDAEQRQRTANLMTRYGKQPDDTGLKRKLRRAKILGGIVNTLAAVAGKSTVPWPQYQAGQNARRSSLLLGIVRGDVVYDAWSPTLQRFKRVQNPPDPVKEYSIWKEVLQNDGHLEAADYILFSADDGARQGSSRDREVKGLDLAGLGCMVRVPTMRGYWCLAIPRDEKAPLFLKKDVKGEARARPRHSLLQ